MKRKIAIEVISFLFILLFVYAAVSKVLDIQKFRVLIGQSPVLTPIAGFVSWFVPAAEIVVSLGLAVPRWRYRGLMGAFSLMVMFTAYIISILQFSEHIPCSCGGVLQILGWKEHLAFNVTFILLAGVAIVLFPEKELGPAVVNHGHDQKKRRE
jgi:uncharacterized membrane protein YphA (DoxX/SURF4 family)